MLVASREQVQEVRRIVEQLKDEQSNTPPSEGVAESRFPWGACRKVDEGPGFVVHRVMVEPGRAFMQRAYDNEKVWTQASGRVTLITDFDERILEPGASVRLATGQIYRLENRSPNAAHALLVVYRESDPP